jgi:hypothetical protein
MWQGDLVSKPWENVLKYPEGLGKATRIHGGMKGGMKLNQTRDESP